MLGFKTREKGATWRVVNLRHRIIDPQAAAGIAPGDRLSEAEIVALVAPRWRRMQRPEALREWALRHLLRAGCVEPEDESSPWRALRPVSLEDYFVRVVEGAEGPKARAAALVSFLERQPLSGPPDPPNNAEWGMRDFDAYCRAAVPALAAPEAVEVFAEPILRGSKGAEAGVCRAGLAASLPLAGAGAVLVLLRLLAADLEDELRLLAVRALVRVQVRDEAVYLALERAKGDGAAAVREEAARAIYKLFLATK
jgi:hypothetical protein